MQFSMRQNNRVPGSTLCRSVMVIILLIGDITSCDHHQTSHAQNVAVKVAVCNDVSAKTDILLAFYSVWYQFSRKT